MSYLLTNASALTALQNLTNTQNSLSQTQSQLSTGLKVSSAADNSSIWSISQTMQSDNGVLGTIASSLAQSASALSNASTAVNQAITVINAIKTDLAAAQQPGADTTKIATDLAAQSKQLISIVSAATFTGQNLLDGSGTGTESYIASYNDNNGTGASTVGTIDLTTVTLYKSGGTTGILQSAKATGSGAATDFTALTASDISTSTIADTVSNADKALADLTSYAATIGATQTRVSEQTTLISSMQTNLTNGVASLIDADMNQVSTRLQALQTQQQLGVQSLSIANQSSQMILKLFQ
jgi:flagellin